MIGFHLGRKDMLTLWDQHRSSMMAIIHVVCTDCQCFPVTDHLHFNYSGYVRYNSQALDIVL